MARAAWSKLHNAFSTGSRSQIRDLKYQLHNLRRGNTSIIDYLQNAKLISDQLIALQHPVSNDDFVESILDGLGTVYRPFTRALEAQMESVTFDELTGFLLSEERQIARENENSSFTPSINFAARNNSFRGRGRGRGHYSGQPSFRPNNSASAPLDVSTLTCHNCKGTRHIAKQCPSPKLNRNSRNNIKPSSNMAVTSQSSSTDWLMDSGATHHLTADLGNLNVHSEYDGTEEVTVGFGNPEGDLSREQ